MPELTEKRPQDDGDGALLHIADPTLDPLFRPALRVGQESAWWQHVPFAHWIVATTKPRLLVELGTHTGVSYTAFCAAVQSGQLATRCYAVDTWRGDEHAGVYGEEILADLAQFHKRFESFSSLLRCRFDEALRHFADNSIDLLHIDGLHTYEAVRDDFEKWLPKLSERGLVIFHDTNVRRQDFGVWKLWSELAGRYPSFEFLHGHGLGVLAVGPEQPREVRDLVGLADPSRIARIRDRFAVLGERWVNETREILAVQKLGRELQAAQHAEAQANDRTIATEAMLKAAQHAEAGANRRIAVTEAMRVQAALAARTARDEAERAHQAAALLAADMSQRASDGEVATLRAELDGIRSSTIWRALEPLRRGARLVPHPVRRALRGAAKIGWWTATLQLRAKLRQRRAAIAALNGPVSPPQPTPQPTPVALASPPSPASPPAAPAPRVAEAVKAMTHHSFSCPIPVFAVPRERPRISMITDSLSPAHLFGGVATSILLGVLLANRLGATFRIVTREDAPDASAVRSVLENNGVVLQGSLDLAVSPVDGSRDLPMSENDVFLTTSWWTTHAALKSLPRERICMLIQEDERMFYPFGDERLLCAETLAQPDIPAVLNTRLLFDHLVHGADRLPDREKNAFWFEPAFPGRQAVPNVGKRRFFFYARPNNGRNLFWRGAAALDAALAEGLFPPDAWEMYWVGKDIPEFTLPHGVTPIRRSGLDWGTYQALVATMDAGLVLMDTPHPSYPPLDLASAGAAVLTNTHGIKTSLERYSANILTAPPTLQGLLQGLRDLQELALDDAGRARNRAADGIARDWNVALEPTVAWLADRWARS